MTTPSHYAGPCWKEETTPVALAAMEETGTLAVALADGRMVFRLLDKPETVLKTLTPHAQGMCAMKAARDGDYVYSAGEDGKILKISAAGEIHVLAEIKNAWVEHLAVHESGFVAAAYKKTVLLFDAGGKQVAELADHPSTIGGIGFDPKGKRLAVAHYGGVSLWWTGAGASQTPQRVSWKGSHLAVAYAPSGKYLLTCMQENALHGWRLPDFADFAMSGYARKPRSFGWTHEGKWLASAGSPGVICWDCSGKGPMGRSALIVGADNPEITTQVACHPSLDMAAAGTEGGSIYLGRFQDDRIVNMKTHGPDEIVSLDWSASGHYLLAGAEDGSCYCWPFSE